MTDLRSLFGSWQLALRGERKAAGTIKTYGDGVTQYLAWCEANDVARLLRSNLSLWIATLLEAGIAAATARTRQLGVRRFVKWLGAEGEIEADPFVGITPPKLDATVIEPLTEDDLRAMIKACQPSKGANASETFRGRRDEALIRFMFETGARAGEMVALDVNDVDLAGGVAIIGRGKGGKGRSVPFGPNAALASIATCGCAGATVSRTPPRCGPVTAASGSPNAALHYALGARADQAELVGFHPHKMRHTAAHRWLAAGGSEGGLMAVAGWSNSQMLHRYSMAQASARAADVARKLDLGRAVNRPGESGDFLV